MKKRTVLLLLTAMTVSLLSACGGKDTETNTGNDTVTESSSETETVEDGGTEGPSTSEAALGEGSVTIYDHDDVKLHAYATGDALGDAAGRRCLSWRGSRERKL